MTFEEYNDCVYNENCNHQDKLTRIRTMYAVSNSITRVGDVVEINNGGMVKVVGTELTHDPRTGEPCFLFIGEHLNGNRHVPVRFYQSSIKRVI